MDESFVLVESEKGDVAGQKRTSGKLEGSKKFTMFKADDPLHIYKGPYHQTERRYQQLIDRNEIFTEWATPRIVHVTEIIEGVEYIFPPGEGPKPKKKFDVVVFENILKRLPKKSDEIYTEKRGDISYYINVDTELVKLSKVFAPKLLTYDLLIGFLHLFILNTGDVGLHNVLYSHKTKETYIIDFEENRTSEFVDNPVFFFTKAPGKKYDFQAWIEMYSDAANELESSDFTIPEGTIFSQDMVDKRVKLAIELLRKYSDKTTENTPKKSPKKVTFKEPLIVQTNQCQCMTTRGGQCKRKPTKGSEFCFQHQDCKAPAKTPPPAKKKTPPPKKTQKVTPPKKEVTPYKGDPGFDKMYLHPEKWDRSITRQGLTISKVKSALQKNIRRGQLDQALACAYEMFVFSEIGGYTIVHNLFNRLSVIACEDVTPGAIGLGAYVTGWNFLWVRSGKLKWIDETDLGDEDKYNFERVAAIVKVLCETPKSRLPSHLWNGYYTLKRTEDADPPGEDVDPIKEGILLKADLEDPNLEELVAVSKAIYQLLVDRDPYVFYWLGKFLEKFVGGIKGVGYDGKVSTLKVAKRGGRSRCDIVLWEIFGKFVPQHLLFPIQNAYFAASEKRPYLQYVATHILYNTLDYSELESLDGWSRLIDEETERFHKDGFDPNVKIVLEDYMLDLHTGKTGDREKLKAAFRKEGSKVTNQDPDYYDEEMEKLYVG